MTGQFDPARVRLSDAEREQAVQRLKTALGEGRLDLEEFTQRTDRVLACRTRGELDALFADLPSPAVALPEAESVLELRPKNSALQRHGNWVVPPSITITGKLGSVVLDFLHAQWANSTVEIDVSTKHTKIEFVVPPDTWVDCNGLELVYGAVRDRCTGGEVPSASHRIVVRGRMQYAHLTLRERSGKPTWWEKLGLPPLS